MVTSILKTNISFFEENTLGTIMNRFSKDVSNLDQYLFIFIECTTYAVKCLISTLILIYLFPFLIVLAVIQLWLLARIRYQCICATRDTMRLKFSLTSPVNSLIQDAFNGLPTLRCMAKIDFYLSRLFDFIDMQMRAHITSNGVNRWIAFRIDI